MKILRIILAVLIGVFAISLLIFMIIVIKGKNSYSVLNISSDSVSTLYAENSYNISDIDSIEVNYDLVYFDVEILRSDSDELIIKEYSSDDTDESDAALVNIYDADNIVTIEPNDIWESISSGWFNVNIRRVEIYLPADYSGSLIVETSSGDIEINCELNIDGELILSTSSGDIDVNDSISITGDYEVSSSSGDINIGKIIDAGDINLSVSSGDIILESVLDAGSIICSTSSGDIYIGEIESAQSLECYANSGDIDIENCNCDTIIQTGSGDVDTENVGSNNIEISTSSGEIDLGISKDAEFNFLAETTSGSIDTFFDDELLYDKDVTSAEGTIGSDPIVDIKLNTTSGDIDVYSN